MSDDYNKQIIRLCTIGMWFNGIAVAAMILVPTIAFLWNWLAAK